MTIRIDNLENSNFVFDNLRDMSETEAARISGGASSSSTFTFTFTSSFSSDGTGRTKETFSDGELSTTITTIFNADGTIDEPSISQALPASAPAMRR